MPGLACHTLGISRDVAALLPSRLDAPLPKGANFTILRCLVPKRSRSPKAKLLTPLPLPPRPARRDSAASSAPAPSTASDPGSGTSWGAAEVPSRAMAGASPTREPVAAGPAGPTKAPPTARDPPGAWRGNGPGCPRARIPIATANRRRKLQAPPDPPRPSPLAAQAPTPTRPPEPPAYRTRCSPPRPSEAARANRGGRGAKPSSARR